MGRRLHDRHADHMWYVKNKRENEKVLLLLSPCIIIVLVDSSFGNCSRASNKNIIK